jgi:chromosome segregation ATPase
MRDFMTFSRATIKPGPGLNLFIGPNGSGKSSIVAAIGLALGGTPKDIGRGSPLGDYIRHGCEQTTIKIQLADAPYVWFSRRIIMEKGGQSRVKSEYRMKRGGKTWKSVNQSAVIQMVAELKIQLDNLCMFLPQERVKEFSTLSPAKLLESTERAIDRELYHMHVNLQVQGKLLRDKRIEQASADKILQGLVDNIRLIRGDVERLRQVDETKARVKKLESQILWLYVRDEQARRIEAKAALRAATDEFKTIDDAQIGALAKALEKLRKERDSVGKKRDNWKAARTVQRSAAEKHVEVGNKIATAQAKIFSAERAKAMAEANRRKYQGILEKALATQREGESLEALTKQRREADARIGDARKKERDLDKKRGAVEAKVKKKKGAIVDLTRQLSELTNRRKKVVTMLFGDGKNGRT